MTKYETLVVSAFTGIMMAPFEEIHKFIEEVLERKVYTHELADTNILDEVQEKLKDRFLELGHNAWNDDSITIKIKRKKESND